jgi:hypothetical protein
MSRCANCGAVEHGKKTAVSRPQASSIHAQPRAKERVLREFSGSRFSLGLSNDAR